MTSPLPQHGTGRYADHARARLAQGAIEYGDASYDRPVHELLGEILEELADVATWARIVEAALRRDLALELGRRARVHAALDHAVRLAEAAYEPVAAVADELARHDQREGG